MYFSVAYGQNDAKTTVIIVKFYQLIYNFLLRLINLDYDDDLHSVSSTLRGYYVTIMSVLYFKLNKN